jgi:hypothetical protein
MRGSPGKRLNPEARAEEAKDDCVAPPTRINRPGQRTDSTSPPAGQERAKVVEYRSCKLPRLTRALRTTP